MSEKRRKHIEVAELAKAAVKIRAENPRMTLHQIAARLGVSYWAVRHYLYNECKAAIRLGR